MSISPQPFKDTLGRWRTKSLFVEFQHPDYPALFTLAEQDREINGVTYISAKRKYLEYQDPAEHTFATAVFSSYQCWKAVCASPDLLPEITLWREELALHLRSIGIKALRERAESGDVAAAKALAKGDYETSATKALRPAGRPRKAGITPSEEDTHRSAWERLRFDRPATADPLTPSPPFTITSETTYHD